MIFIQRSPLIGVIEPSAVTFGVGNSPEGAMSGPVKRARDLLIVRERRMTALGSGPSKGNNAALGAKTGDGAAATHGIPHSN
jgi:hypothetical protein